MGLIEQLSERWNRRVRPPAIDRGLLEARITHTRFGPRPYALSHRLTYLHVPLAALGELTGPLLGYNRARLYSLRDRDHGDGRSDLALWLDAAFRAVGVPRPDGEVRLLTLPRVAGFVFNPVSFWLCHDGQGRLAAVLAEVNNTFGERHAYLCRSRDGKAITSATEIAADKVFHVSPFMPDGGEYRFRFSEHGDRLSIRIDLYREGARRLTATIAGRLAPLTSSALLKAFLRHPFPTLQVVGLIHYHAARLFMRGHKVFTKPEPPRDLVTTSTTDTTALSSSELA